jgi:hypothetical protein
MSDTNDVFLQEVMEIDERDEDGELDIAAINRQIGHFFVDEQEQPIQGLTAYHREGSRFVELSHIGDANALENVGDLQLVLAFPNAADLQTYIRSRPVAYRSYNGEESFADGVLRRIHVGTHLPVFVRHVEMQEQGNSFLAITHTDERFNLSGQINDRAKGAELKRTYYSRDELRFTWIRAGGHGKSGDAET